MNPGDCVPSKVLLNRQEGVGSTKQVKFLTQAKINLIHNFVRYRP